MNIDFLINNLNTITPESFSLTSYFLRNIQPHIKSANYLGEGAFGAVYKIPNTNLVVKVVEPCLGFVHATELYCDDMKNGSQIIRTINSNRRLIIFPNYLGEAIIGGFLNYLQYYTPHFTRIYGIYLSSFEEKSYQVMEQVKTNIHDVINTKEDVYLMLFQIAHGLTTAQDVFRFNHYDLHAGNIGYIDVDTDYYEYHYDSITAYVRNPQFLVKIYDYGLSRVENSTYIINSKYDNIPIDSYSVFNAYYDFLALMGSLLTSNFDLAQKVRSLLTSDELANLLGFIVGEYKQSTVSSNDFIDDIMDKYYGYSLNYFGWRPYPTHIRHTLYTNPRTINQILIYLSSILKDIIVVKPDFNSRIIHTQMLPSWMKRYKYQPLIYKTIDVQNFGNINVIDEGIEERSITNVVFPRRHFNYTGNLKSNEKHLTIHTVYINSRLALSRGYSFKSLCCKMDPLTFMENYYGVTINGGFYDIGNTYELVGRYRQMLNNYSYETNTEIQPYYDYYYGYLVVDNGIAIYPLATMSIDEYSTMQNAFAAGPVLIWEGRPLIDEADMNITEHKIRIFQCQNPSPPSDRKLVPLSKPPGLDLSPEYTFNCTKIQPGELSHGSNPNPRTMLITRDGDFDIVFVVVEGRNDRSDGADFLDLVEIAQQLGARNAINLDGGRSSNIVWRSPKDPNTITASTYIESYPVGNILTLSKQAP